MKESHAAMERSLFIEEGGGGRDGADLILSSPLQACETGGFCW